MNADSVIATLRENGFMFIRTDYEVENFDGTYEPAHVDFCKHFDENNHVTITHNTLDPDKNYNNKTKWIVTEFNNFGGNTFYRFNTNEEIIKYLVG